MFLFLSVMNLQKMHVKFSNRTFQLLRSVFYKFQRMVSDTLMFCQSPGPENLVYCTPLAKLKDNRALIRLKKKKGHMYISVLPFLVCPNLEQVLAKEEKK